MITGFTFSLVIAVAVVGSVPSASARREQFDLEDLMNKFLTEYDTKATDPQHQPVAHRSCCQVPPDWHRSGWRLWLGSGNTSELPRILYIKYIK